MESWYQKRRTLRSRQDYLRPKLSALFRQIRNHFSHLEKDPVTEQTVFTVEQLHTDTLFIRPFFDGPTLTVELPTNAENIAWTPGERKLEITDILDEGKEMRVAVREDAGIARERLLHDLIDEYLDIALGAGGTGYPR